MYGTLSQTSSGRGISFYRVMALCGLIGVTVFSFVFIIAFGSQHELLWDRLCCFLFAAYIYIYSFKPSIDTLKFVRLVQLMFYIHVTQVLWSVIWNDFNPFYFLSLFITVQAYAYALRNERETFWFLLYTCVIALSGLFLFSDLQFGDLSFYAFIIVIICGLQYLASRVKCRFMRDMRMSQDLLKSLVMKTEDAIFLTDINGNIFDVNTRALELFGYAKSELVDKDFKILRKNNLTSEEIEQGLQQLEKNKFWNTQTTLVPKNGSEFPVRLSVTLIKNGTKKYIVYRVLDYTSMMENEARILEAKENAEEAARAKSQFLAVMSHEIRTPLNGVIATASLMQQSDLNHEQDEYINTIRKSGQSLLMLINDILEFSKMENDKMMLDPNACNVDDIVFDVTDLLRPHAESKGVNLTVNMGASIPNKLLLDDHRLKQILVNLTGNAIKFTDKGKVEVSCDLIETMRDVVTLKFSIKDSGIGIPADKLHLLFQAFSQVDSSTSRKYGGTGLGLAITKQLVELMGGKIEVESSPGIGSSFSFTIKSEVVNEDLLVTPLSKKEAWPASFSQLKVMVAEDNIINQQVLKYMLDNLQVESDLAENGSEVMLAYSSKVYDIIFMDMQMPLMDGLTATRMIRSGDGYQPIIIAISANSFGDDRQRCADAGMNDFMCKPFDLEQLREILARWQYGNSHKLISAA